MPERIPAQKAGYVHVLRIHASLMYEKKAGRADFLQEKADADRVGLCLDGKRIRSSTSLLASDRIRSFLSTRRDSTAA